MKNQVVKNVENVANVVANRGNVTTKGDKPAPAENATSTTPTRRDTETEFMNFVVSNEQIGISKFFKLLAKFKEKHPAKYAEFITLHRLNLEFDYSYSWFEENCPSIEENGKSEFAYWKKVTASNPASDNPAHNRETGKGVKYTLVAYHCYKANWEQYLRMFNQVNAEIERVKREKKRKDETEKRDLKKVKKIVSDIKEIINRNPDIAPAQAVEMYCKVNNIYYTVESIENLLTLVA